MTTEKQLSQTHRDACSLLFIANAYAGKTDGKMKLSEVAKWFELTDDIRWRKELKKERTHPVHLNHVQMDVEARIAANAVLSFIAMVESGMTVSKALKEAKIWVLESRVRTREDRYARVEKALRSIYEFKSHHDDALKEVIEAS